MKRAFWLKSAALVVLAGLLFPGCQRDSVVQEKLGEVSTGCLVNSDCESPLVCAFERCHAECVTTRDCDGTLRCVGAKEAARVCQLESEATCKTTADCAPGFVCGSDGSCRDTCERDDQCIGEQVCTKGVCAEPEELDESGALPQVLDQQTCRLSSDCPLGARCEAGVCLPECLTDRDCVAGSACQDGACVAPILDVCESPADCETPGQQCVDGSCRCACRKDVDCGSGESCDGCGCQPAAPPECRTLEDCDPGKQCVDGSCACGCIEDRDCAGGLTCDGCICRPAPGRVIVADAVLNDSADMFLMRDVVEVTGKLKLTGSHLRSTVGLEALRTVGELEIYGMNAAPDGPDAGMPLQGLAGLELIRGNLSITSTSNLRQLPFSSTLIVGGDVVIDSTELTCAQLGEFEAALRQHDEFDDNTFTARYAGTCAGACTAGVCTPL